jgi:pimeloyl-ACP methyl ester carboxylesterase
MPSTYTEKVVSARSRDGFLLEGLLIAPAERTGRPLVWIHGVYAAFYAPPGLEVCRALAQLGVTCVLGNTRGHNVGAWMRNADGRVVLGGGAWESLADAPHDIAGWIDFTRGLDEGVVLAGHSLGARKATLYVANEHDARVSGLVIASPTARATSIDAPSERRAKELTAQGTPNELLPLESGWAASASNYLERFGPGSVGQAFASMGQSKPLLAGASVPVLALIGGKERATNEDARAELDLLRTRASSSPAFTAHVVTGADHLYAGTEQDVAAHISTWMHRL